MKRQIKRYIRGILFLVFMYSMTIVTMASVPKTIKVGLESVYKNQGTIVLSGNQNFEIGYFDDKGFTALGALNASNLSLRTTSNSYYDIGLSFNNYSSALEAAKLYSSTAVVGYTSAGTFSVYSLEATNSLGAVPSSNLVEVYDTSNQLLLVTVKKSDLVFCSFD